MAFSTNLRGLRSAAMAVLVSGNLGYAEKISTTETIYQPLEKANAGIGSKSLIKKK